MSTTMDWHNTIAEKAWRRPHSYLVNSRSSSPVYESSEDEGGAWKTVGHAAGKAELSLGLGSLRKRLEDKPVKKAPAVKPTDSRDRQDRTDSYCKLCKTDLSSRVALAQHDEVKHFHVCDTCGQRHYGWRNKHRECHGFTVKVGAVTSSWSCCGKSFSIRSAMLQHQQKKHFEDLLCLQCEQVLVTVQACEDHMQAKHPQQYASKFFRKPPHLI